MAHIAEDYDGPATHPPARVAAPEFSGWIPVGERVPVPAEPPDRFSVRVLVRVETDDSRVTVAIDTYCDVRWGWSVHGLRVTHWQPLPSAELGP